MLKRLTAGLVVALAVTGSASATTFDLNFNDDSAQAQVDITIGRDQYGTSSFNGRFLYNDDDDTRLGSAGVRFAGEPGNVPGLELGVGAQAYAGEAGENRSVDLGGVGVGGFLTYAPARFGGISVGGRMVYVPDVFSYFDTERIVESALRVGFAITPKISIHTEYQNVRVKVEDYSGTHTVDEEVRFGFTGTF